MKKRIIALMAMLTIVAGVLVGCGKDPVISDHFPGVYWGESKVGVESAFGDKVTDTELYTDETSTIGVIDAAKLGFPTRDNVELYATYTVTNDALTTICVTYSSENEDDIKAITASLLTFLDDEYGNPKKKDAYSENFVYEWSTNKAYVKLESYGDLGLILTYKAPQK
jgi:hypothetical protein